MYASTSARRASASIRRAPSRTISSITNDAADRPAPEPSRSAESETTVSIGSYLPDQRCRAGLAWNLSSVTREGTPHPKPIHRFQALLDTIRYRFNLTQDIDQLKSVVSEMFRYRDYALHPAADFHRPY